MKFYTTEFLLFNREDFLSCKCLIVKNAVSDVVWNHYFDLWWHEQFYPPLLFTLSADVSIMTKAIKYFNENSFDLVET